MRIKLVSDLHVEEWRHKPLVWSEGAGEVDVLVWPRELLRPT